MKPLQPATLTSAAMALCFLAPAASGQTTYGPFTGDTITYNEVTESSSSGILYDTPTLSGDSLFFTPTSSFNATSTGGGSQITDGLLYLDISANKGQAVHSLVISENGTYEIFYTGKDTSSLLAQVTVGLSVPTLTINEVDGAAVDTPITVSLGTDNHVFSLPGDVGSGTWSALRTADLDNILDENGISYTQGVTGFELTLDNTLTAASSAGGSGTIVKTAFQVMVPEPSSTSLLALGALGLLVRRRR